MKKSIIFCIIFTFFSLVSGTSAAQNIVSPKRPALVVHGGAGTILKQNLTAAQEQAYHAKIQEALNRGYQLLKEGASAEEAVVATLVILEDSPLFNAGKGAVFTHDGTNEMDAAIMNGADGTAGAVTGVKNIKNPILAALEVKNHSAHVMMSGQGAEEFATSRGLEIVDATYFYTDKRMEQLKKLQQEEKSKPEGSIKNLKDHKFGTVGAVALDLQGNICAATSTGGMTNKRYGRIGDSPIIGAGTFANKICGISATGHGEYFIRNVVAYDIAARMEYKGLPLAESAAQLIMQKLKSLGGSGGIIGLDVNGNITMTFNTPGMYRGYICEMNQPKSYIYESEQ